MTQDASLSWLDDHFVADRPVLVNADTGTLANIASLMSMPVARAGSIRFTGASPTLTGITNGVMFGRPRRLVLMAVGGPLVIANDNAASSSENRIVTGTGASVTVPQGGAALVAYDDTSLRWRLVGATGGGGGGGSTPTGTGFTHVTSGVQDGAAKKVDLTASADVTVPAAGVVKSSGTALSTSAVNLASEVTGTLPRANGGTGHGGAAQAIGALNIDWSTGSVFTKTLAAGANTITFSNQASGMVIVVRLTSNGGGSTVTWPTVKWAGGTPPTQTSTGTDVYTFVHDGTSIYGSVVQAMA